MKIPPPDYSLIQKHQAYLDQWKKDKEKDITAYIEAGKPIVPVCYVTGYDYYTKQYCENLFLFDQATLDNPVLKLQMYYALRNITGLIDYQPLALMFAVHGYADVQNEMQRVLYVTYETRLAGTHAIYRITDDVTVAQDGTPHRIMTFDPDLSAMQVMEEMKEFLSLFHLEVAQN